LRLVQIKRNSLKSDLNEHRDHAKTGITAAKILILKQKRVRINRAEQGSRFIY
jgi:hypothetical protein